MTVFNQKADERIIFKVVSQRSARPVKGLQSNNNFYYYIRFPHDLPGHGLHQHDSLIIVHQTGDQYKQRIVYFARKVQQKIVCYKMLHQRYLLDQES